LRKALLFGFGSAVFLLAAVLLSGCGTGAPPQVTPVSVQGGYEHDAGATITATIQVARPELVPESMVEWSTDPPGVGQFLQSKGYAAVWKAPADITEDRYVVLKVRVTDTRGHSSESSARVLIRAPADAGTKPRPDEPLRVSISLPDGGQIVGPGQPVRLDAKVTRPDLSPTYTWRLVPSDAGQLLPSPGGESATWVVPTQVAGDMRVTISVTAAANGQEDTKSVDFLVSPTGAGGTGVVLPPTGLSFQYSNNAPRPNEVVEITVSYNDNGTPVDEILWKVESAPGVPEGHLLIYSGDKAVWRAPQNILANQTAVYVFTVTLKNRRGLTATGVTTVAVRW